MCRPERSPRRLQKKILLLRKKPIKMGEKKSEQEGFYPFDTQAHRADIRECVAMECVSHKPSDSLNELFLGKYGENDDSFEEEETART